MTNDELTNFLANVANESKDIPEIREKFKNVLVQKEQDSRVDTLVKLYDKINAQKVELLKIKPDNLFNENGEIISSTYTKQKLDEKKKAQEQLDKLQNAFSAALFKGDFSKAKDLAK